MMLLTDVKLEKWRLFNVVNVNEKNKTVAVNHDLEESRSTIFCSCAHTHTHTPEFGVGVVAITTSLDAGRAHNGLRTDDQNITLQSGRSQRRPLIGLHAPTGPEAQSDPAYEWATRKQGIHGGYEYFGGKEREETSCRGSINGASAP